MGNMAKCYGINAAHKNDCKSPAIPVRATTPRRAIAFIATNGW